MKTPTNIDEKWVAVHGKEAGYQRNIYKNPSKAEVQTIRASESTYAPGILRVLLDRGGMGDLYMCSADITHQMILRALEPQYKYLKKPILPLYIHAKAKTITLSYIALQSRGNRTEFGIDQSGYDIPGDPNTKSGWRKAMISFWSKNIAANRNFKALGMGLRVSAEDKSY